MARSRGNNALQIDRSPKAEFSITPRQREILKMVALGHTNRDIAESLAISIRTVEVHRARVFDKMAVKSAVELANLLRD